MGRFRLISKPVFIFAALLFFAGCAGPFEKYLMRLEMDDVDLSTPGRFTVCHGNGCRVRSEASLAGAQWRQVMGLFNGHAQSPGPERIRISRAIAMIEAIVGEETGTHTDYGENVYKYYDQGQMDCVDETINASLYLRFLEEGGALSWHAVAEPQRRGFFWPHSAAVVKEIQSGDRCAVDSWFYKNGEEPVIVPVEDWLSGWRPAREKQ